MLFIHLIQKMYSCTGHGPFDIVPYQANELSEIILAPCFSKLNRRIRSLSTTPTADIIIVCLISPRLAFDQYRPVWDWFNFVNVCCQRLLYRLCVYWNKARLQMATWCRVLQTHYQIFFVLFCISTVMTAKRRIKNWPGCFHDCFPNQCRWWCWIHI